MQEVYRYDFETKQCILRKLEEESNASLEDYEDPPAAKEEEDTSDNDNLREETQQVNQRIRLTPIAPIQPLPPVTTTQVVQIENTPDKPPGDGPPDGEPPRGDRPTAGPMRAPAEGPTIMGSLHRYSQEIVPRQQNLLKKSKDTSSSTKTYQDSIHLLKRQHLPLHSSKDQRLQDGLVTWAIGLIN